MIQIGNGNTNGFFYFDKLSRITKDEWLPDGSEKPDEALWAESVPDLQRTAGTKDDKNYCC